MSKKFADIVATTANLKTNIKAYRNGDHHTYRVVAVQLRLLLCDKPLSLIQRLSDNPRLHPLRGNSNKIDDHTVLYIQGRLSFDGKGGAKMHALFDEGLSPMPISEWLSQPLINNKISIRELIKAVADKEGAHADQEYGKTLAFAKSIYFSTVGSEAETIVAIGEYLLKQLESAGITPYPFRPQSGG